MDCINETLSTTTRHEQERQKLLRQKQAVVGSRKAKERLLLGKPGSKDGQQPGSVRPRASSRRPAADGMGRDLPPVAAREKRTAWPTAPSQHRAGRWLSTPSSGTPHSSGMVITHTWALSMQKLPESHGAQLLQGQLLCLQGYGQVLTANLNPK